MTKKMDKRIDYKIVLDTETCPMDKDLNTVDPYNMLVYDIGWVIADKKGRIYEKRSYVVKDIFYGETDMMKSAYYADKIPQYEENLKNGTSILATFYEIRQALLKDMYHYGVTELYAHNARFDYGCLNNTQRWLTKSKYRYYFPKELTICDTMKMATDTICKQKSYRAFCEKYGHMTKNKQVRKTAEVLYKYISGNYDFEEEHKGLDDVLIETQIMAKCYRQHKKMRRRLWDN